MVKAGTERLGRSVAVDLGASYVAVPVEQSDGGVLQTRIDIIGYHIARMVGNEFFTTEEKQDAVTRLASVIADLAVINVVSDHNKRQIIMRSNQIRPSVAGRGR